MIGIDTNVLVRYFTRDDQAQASVAKRFIENALSPGEPGFVSLVTLAELAWVLASRYQVLRDDLFDVIEVLLGEQSIHVQDSKAVWAALDDCQQTGCHLANTLVASIGRLHGCSHTVTFDTKATRIAGMTLLR